MKCKAPTFTIGSCSDSDKTQIQKALDESLEKNSIILAFIASVSAELEGELSMLTLNQRKTVCSGDRVHSQPHHTKCHSQGSSKKQECSTQDGAGENAAQLGKCKLFSISSSKFLTMTSTMIYIIIASNTD